MIPFLARKAPQLPPPNTQSDKPHISHIPGVTLYNIHAPYSTQILSAKSADGYKASTFEREHVIVAEGAIVDAPHANTWMATGRFEHPPVPAVWAAKKILVQLNGDSWEAREQSPEIQYESEDEVILLDEHVLERDLDTGVIGVCGEVGCKSEVGCVDCKGSSRFVRPSPRGEFREAVARQESLLVPEAGRRVVTPPPAVAVPLCAEKGYPKHLQRLLNPSVVMDIPETLPPLRPILSRGTPYVPDAAPLETPKKTGPKIKYIRKRIAMIPEPEKVVEKVVSTKRRRQPPRR